MKKTTGEEHKKSEKATLLNLFQAKSWLNNPTDEYKLIFRHNIAISGQVQALKAIYAPSYSIYTFLGQTELVKK